MNVPVVPGVALGLILFLGGCQTPARGVAAQANLRVLDWAGYDGAVSFTFDDSQPSQMQHWPEIQATGVRATWYLSPAYGSGPAYEALWQEVVAAGHEVGNHTLSHRPLQPATAAEELEACDQFIKGRLGQREVWTVAYPFGDTGWRPYVAQYLFARTVTDGLVSATAPSDPLLLPTFLAQEGMTAAVFNAKIDGAARSRSWQTLLFHSLTPTTANWYAGVPAADVVASLEYGKSLGSVWLDSVVNIGAYWTAARWLRAAVPMVKGGEVTWRWTVPPHFPPGKALRVTVQKGALSQNGLPLASSDQGVFEVPVDPGHLVWRP